MGETINPAPTDAASRDVELWRMNGLVGTALTRHGPMLFFKNDCGALTSSLQAYGEWAEHEIMFCKRFLSQGDIVLDVGAYIGSHSLAFAQFVGPTGHVYGFEAQPASFALLVQNLLAARITNVTARNAAVGAVDAETLIALDEIDIARQCSFGSTAVSATGDAGLRTQVPATSLDQMDLGRCSFMKIDVEGMEDRVLAGAQRLLRSCAPVVYAECNTVDAGSRTIAQLRAAGYDVWLHAAAAFNPENWRTNPVNIFGDAKEMALVGVPPHLGAACGSLRVGVHERFFAINTIDDLVAGMLLKPQYPREVLLRTTACQADGRHV